MASLIKRNGTFYLQWYVGTKIRRQSLHTQSLQIAKDKLRQFESAQLRGIDNPLPTRTPIPQVVAAYVQHIRTIKTPKSAQTDIYYLREAFGEVCDALKITSRQVNEAARKRMLTLAAKRDRRECIIEASCFEHITTAQIADFISRKVRSRNLAPKTANRYREILHRLFNWAMDQHGIRMPGDINPVRRVERFKQKAPEIRFLTLEQIDEQLHALRFNPRLQTIVAVYIYAGLRREEALWLTIDDLDLSRKHGGHGIIRVRAKTVGDQSWQPKTRINRAVPISANLRTYLDNYTPLKSDGDWYFPSPEGKRWDCDNFSRTLRAAQRETGLDWGCLDFRHTFGSQLAQKGVSLYKIATLMGNSPEICRRDYAALVPEAMVGDVEFQLNSNRIGIHANTN